MENKYSDELYHHGIKGQKWGIRRWQRLDGTLTPAGIERYGHAPEAVKERRLYSQIYRNNMFAPKTSGPVTDAVQKFMYGGQYDKWRNSPNYYGEENIQRAKDFVKECAGAKLEELGYDNTEKAENIWRHLGGFKTWFHM